MGNLLIINYVGNKLSFEIYIKISSLKELMFWEQINSKIFDDERYVFFIKSSKLLSQDIELPNIQRIRDDDKVNDIINYQLNYFKKKNKFNFFGVINIHYCKQNSTFYLVDGQHRYESMKRLYTEMSHEVSVCVEIVCVDDLDNLRENYNILNKNTPLPDFPDSIDKNLVEKVANHFKEKYPNIWSKNSRARRPHLYFNFFQESLAALVEKLNIKDHKTLQKIVEDYNYKLAKWNKEQFPDSSSINDNMLSKCQDNGIYLGLFKHISDDYGYKWVHSIIYNESGIIIKNSKSNVKKKIPNKIKTDSWNIYVGENIKKTLCICCNKTEIDAFNFQAGHIISEKNGGSICIDNILPICNLCNNSMGITNMDEYIREYYPSNFKNFSLKKYDNQLKPITGGLYSLFTSL